MPSTAATTRYRQIFAHRAFTFLWIGQTVSNFGDTLYDVALLWYVLGATGSTRAPSPSLRGLDILLEAGQPAAFSIGARFDARWCWLSRHACC